VRSETWQDEVFFSAFQFMSHVEIIRSITIHDTFFFVYLSKPKVIFTNKREKEKGENKEN
jgi:hypothetical protein